MKGGKKLTDAECLALYAEASKASSEHVGDEHAYQVALFIHRKLNEI